MSRFAIALVLSVLGHGVTKGQGYGSCMDELRDAVKNMRELVECAPEHALSARMEIISVAAGADAQANTLVTDHASATDRLVLENEQFSHYEDEEVRVLAIHPEKVILIYDQPVGLPTRSGQWQQFNDTLFTVGRIVSCRRYNDGSSERAEMELVVPDSVEIGGVKSIVYTIHRGTRMVIAMKTTYRPGHQQATYAVRYLEFEPGKVDPRTRSSALGHVYSRGKLRQQFATYMVHDKRRKTRHATSQHR